MIRIKAPRVKRRPFDPPGSIHRGRWISEPMHRRVLALVRACEMAEKVDRLSIGAQNALHAVKEQAEKEAK